MNFDEYQYHPRYTRSEYDDLRARERRINRRAVIGAVLVLAGVIGLIYIVR